MKKDDLEVRGVIAILVTISIAILASYCSKPEKPIEAVGYWTPQGVIDFNQIQGEIDGN